MSNIVPYRIQLDIKEVTSQLSMSISLGDTGRRLIIQLVDDGKAFELARGTYAIFTAIKEDGNTIYNDCTIQDNTIIYDITEQTVSYKGIVDCEIVIYDGNGYRLTSPRFTMIVYDAIRTRVDLQSATENLAIDEIGLQEAYRQLQESKRQDNEASRVINEETRTINEAYRIASGNVIRAFLGGYNLPSLESPMDILMVIDMKLANVNTNNYFTCKDKFIRGIAIVGNTSTEGDITTIDTIEPHKVYNYKGLRFVPVTMDVPESSILDDFSAMVEQAAQSAEQAKIWAENANTIAVQKPTVYFESNFAGLLVSVLHYNSIKQGDIFILTDADLPDFVVLTTDVSVNTSNVVYIKQEDIPHNVPTPEVGKIYAIEGKDYALIAIESGIQTPAIDSALNPDSTNPVMNKVITLALEELEEKIGTGGGSGGGTQVQIITWEVTD